MLTRSKWISLISVPVIGGLLFAGISQQRPRPKQPAPPTAEKSVEMKEQAVKYRRFKVTGSSPTLAVSAKVADAVRKNPKALQYVDVQGNSLKAKAGLAFAKLGNGASILTNGSNALSPYMDTVVTHVEWGLIVFVCRCAGSTKEGDDSCKFENKNP